MLIVSGGVSVKKQKFDGVKSKADVYNGDYKTDCEFFNRRTKQKWRSAQTNLRRR